MYQHEKSPWWARAKVGKNKVYWVVRDDYGWSDPPPRTIAEGYTRTFEEAEAAALDAVAKSGLPARQTHANSASYHHSKLAKERRAAKGAKTTGAQMREYLYTRHYSEYRDESYISAHLILKKTPKKVFTIYMGCPVEWLGTSHESWNQRGHDEAVVLDRAKLERGGSIWSRSARERFYLDPDEAAGRHGKNFTCHAYEVLGLEGKATIEDVKAAYRRKALECHPDRGGNADDFTRIETAYRQALQMFAA